MAITGFKSIIAVRGAGAITGFRGIIAIKGVGIVVRAVDRRGNPLNECLITATDGVDTAEGVTDATGYTILDIDDWTDILLEKDSAFQAYTGVDNTTLIYELEPPPLLEGY